MRGAHTTKSQVASLPLLNEKSSWIRTTQQKKPLNKVCRCRQPGAGPGSAAAVRSGTRRGKAKRTTLKSATVSEPQPVLWPVPSGRASPDCPAVRAARPGRVSAPPDDRDRESARSLFVRVPTAVCRYSTCVCVKLLVCVPSHRNPLPPKTRHVWAARPRQAIISANQEGILVPITNQIQTESFETKFVPN